MKKYKYLSIALGGMIIICLGFIFFASNEIPHLNKKIATQKQSASEIDKYFESKPTALVVNSEAEQSFAKPLEGNSEEKHVYYSPDGIKMVSDTDQWDETKLQALYGELMANEHGEEMQTMHEVFIHGDGKSDRSGDHGSDMQTYNFKIDFPAIPSTCEIDFVRQMGTINLYGGDKENTVESQAVVLSHEYGHHYTYHYMFEEGYKLLDSEYAKIRNLPKDKVLVERGDSDFYKKNHRWYLIEIAADDYVQLMGSPTAKRIVNYYDSNDHLHNSNLPWYPFSINGTPQENFDIPLAFETEGLYDYYYSFINGGTRVKPEAHEKLPINITIERRSKHHELSTGPTNFVYYEVRWNMPYNIDGVVYTLVAYSSDDFDYLYSIKTVRSNEVPLAYVGTTSYASNNGYIYWQQDEIDKGKKTFVVTATFPDGTIFKSEPFVYNFK